MSAEVRRLTRSSRHKVIAGVCGGLSEYFEIDPSIIRILAVVLLCISGGTFTLGYVLAWMVIPLDTNLPSSANAGVAQTGAPGVTKSNRPSFWSTYFPGIVLIIIGSAFLMRQFWYWVDMSLIWPAILIVIGLFIIAFSYGSDRLFNGKNQSNEGAVS